MSVNAWMSWEGGVDLVAATRDGLTMPNVIVHVARSVHTPAGSAPSGMVLWQPDPEDNPMLMGFVSGDPDVAAYFGPNVFADTPFQGAPALDAVIDIETSLPDHVSSRVQVGELVLEVTLSGLGPMEASSRDPGPTSPFSQEVIESVASDATLRVNGEEVPILVPPVGISGGPAAVWAPTGLYHR